jgi:hypothetical protein
MSPDNILVNFEYYTELGKNLFSIRFFDKETERLISSVVMEIEGTIKSNEFCDSKYIDFRKILQAINELTMGLDKENPWHLTAVRWKDGSFAKFEKELGVE